MLGNCLEIMGNIPRGSIDMVLCDPPYGTTACNWDSVIPFAAFWENINRVIKTSGAICIFGVEPFSSALRMSNIKNFKYDWIWVKNRPDGFLNAKKQPLRKHEIISIFCNKSPPYNPQIISIPPTKMKANNSGSKSSCFGSIKNEPPKYIVRDFKYPNNFLKFDKVLNGRQHPTQKPTYILEYLIKTYTKKGELILDPTMGSGSTGVACKNINRNFIGIEKDEKYFKIAEERISHAASTLKQEEMCTMIG